MSNWRIAAAGIAITLFAALMPTEAPARMRIGINPVGVARMAVGRVLSLGRMRHARAHARYGATRTAALRPQAVGRTATGSSLIDPAARRQITAVAALAGMRNAAAADGWWRHGDGGYGWVGPLFWPFAVYDMHDYAVLGDGSSFWNYGYPDIYAGIFAPYGQAELAAFTGARPSARRHRKAPSLQQLCNDDSQAMALVGQVQQAVQPNTDAQRAAMDELAAALMTSAKMIQTSCPTQAVLSAPERLGAMQQRIGTMIAAGQALQQPLTKFYDLLDDEQEARLNALAADRRKASPANDEANAAVQACGASQSPPLQWPAAEIEARLKLNDTQRAALRNLQDANATAIGLLGACPPTDTTTPPARLDAVDARLNAMQQAVYLVSTALAEFYATLNESQKSQFEAIGQKRTA